MQWAFPEIAIRWGGPTPDQLVTRLLDVGASFTIEQEEDELKRVRVRGKQNLWLRLLHAYREWLDMGQPSRNSYTFCRASDGAQKIEVETGDAFRIFPLNRE
jgi:hypothetical protein